MVKIRFGKGTVAIISVTIWLLVGYVLNRFIGSWSIPVGCVVGALVLGVVFRHGLGAGVNIVFFLLAVPYAITKTTHLGMGAAVGLFAAVIVVVLGALLVCLIPDISPVVALMMRSRLRRVAATVGTRPAAADDAVRAVFQPVWSPGKDPFKYPVVQVPRQDTTLVFTIDRWLTDRWAVIAPTPVTGEPVGYRYVADGVGPRGAEDGQTALTDHVLLVEGTEPAARSLLSPGLQQLMGGAQVEQLWIHRGGVVVRLHKDRDVQPENFRERMAEVDAVVREVGVTARLRRDDV